MTTTNTKPSSGQPDREERPDRRVTIRLRHHCDADLIQVLEQVSNVSEFIRQSLRRDLDTQRQCRRWPPSESVTYRRAS